MRQFARNYEPLELPAGGFNMIHDIELELNKIKAKEAKTIELKQRVALLTVKLNEVIEQRVTDLETKLTLLCKSLGVEIKK
jgi:hypothetical protein